MGLVARLINAIPGAHWLSLPDEVATFGRMMQSQLDLRNEAHHLALFAKRFAHRNNDGITFPLVIEEYKRQSVLIEDFAVGIPINKFLTLGPSVFDETLARQGLRSFLVRYSI
jgi:aarF domain-containing kinase